MLKLENRLCFPVTQAKHCMNYKCFLLSTFVQTAAYTNDSDTATVTNKLILISSQTVLALKNIMPNKIIILHRCVHMLRQNVF